MVLGHHYPNTPYPTPDRYRCQKCGKVFKRDMSSKVLPAFLSSMIGLFACPRCSSEDVKEYWGINSKNWLMDNVFRDKVKPVVGSVVCCDLAKYLPTDALLGVTLEHSGIYVGWGKIAHRDGGGYLKLVSTTEFISRFDGNNCAMSIYVSCKNTTPIGSRIAAKRARSSITDSEHEGYSILWKNCHQFVQYCITGEIHGSVFDCTFSSLQSVIEENYGFDNWRVWELSYKKTRQL